MMTALSPDAVRSVLPEGWAYEGDALTRTFTFADFRAAFAFLVRVAFEAEAADHHPEITNVYDRVTLRLTTHDAGDRVTARDLDLAVAIDRIGA